MQDYSADIGRILHGTGKTKIIFGSKSDPYVIYARNKDVVTWGNEHQCSMPGKAAWATSVNHAIFSLLEQGKYPVAYRGQMDEDTFMAEMCDMFPFEVVAVGVVDEKSSFRKRQPNPDYPAEMRFTEPVIQFFLKTSGKVYRGRKLACDDPFLDIGPQKVSVYLPHKPIQVQEPMFEVSLEDAPRVFPGFEHHARMEHLARQTFCAARDAFARVGGRLYDWKEEFGLTKRDGRLVIADVLDADSLRLTVNGERADKQPIRNGGEPAIPEQIAAYKLAVEISRKLAA